MISDHFRPFFWGIPRLTIPDLVVGGGIYKSYIILKIIYNMEDGEGDIYRCDIWIPMLGWAPHTVTVITRTLCVCFFVGTPIDLHLPLLMCRGWTQWKYISCTPILMFHLAPIEIGGKIGQSLVQFQVTARWTQLPNKGLFSGVSGTLGVWGPWLTSHDSERFQPQLLQLPSDFESS